MAENIIPDSVIIDLATNPKRVSGDQGTVEMQSLADVLAAQRATTPAAAKPGRGLRFTQLISPGPGSG